MGGQGKSGGHGNGNGWAGPKGMDGSWVELAWGTKKRKRGVGGSGLCFPYLLTKNKIHGYYYVLFWMNLGGEGGRLFDLCFLAGLIIHYRAKRESIERGYPSIHPCEHDHHRIQRATTEHACMAWHGMTDRRADEG